MDITKIFSTIDTHVAGEPFRIVTQSSIVLDQNNIKANNVLLQENFVTEKNFLLNEPRGHRGMSCCIVTPSQEADYGLLFFSHEGVDFKYGGLVASLTALLETGNLPANEDGNYRIETINGVYNVQAKINDGEVEDVYLVSDKTKFIESQSDYDVVTVDSRTYLIFQLPSSIPTIGIEYVSEITSWGRATAEKLHKEGIKFDGYIIIEKSNSNINHIRSVTFETDGSILRSANIDSTVAILTSILQISKELEQLTNESIFGSAITVKTIPGLENQYSTRLKAFITGIHEFIYDEDDPLKNGFILK